jgi:hypothetical protein
MHKNAMKCNKTQSKWCINKHGASKIIDTFETYQLTEGGGEALWRATFASTDRLAREEEGFGLFLLPNGWLGCRFIGAEDDKATMETSLGWFLLPRGRPRPHFSTTAPVSRSITPASAISRSANILAKQERKKP